MPPVNPRVRTQLWWASVVLLLLLAFGARAWDLTKVPPGLTHDEASNGHDSAAILRGVHHIYFPVGYGHEPLYNYSAALTTALLGQSIFTLRITTVVWGLLQIVLTTALARRWWGRGAAITTLAVYVTSFWALMLSRVGLRASTLPALLAASVLAYDHALPGRLSRCRLQSHRQKWHWYLLSGVFLGLSFYTYMASRSMPLMYMGSLAATALIDRHRFRLAWRGTLLLLVVAAVVGAPLFMYLWANPGLEQRIGQLGHAITALLQGDPGPMVTNITDSLPMLIWRGDPYWLYNVAGRPGLEPLLALAFLVGLGVSLSRLRDPRHMLLLLWLGGGTAPALLAPVAYNLLHAIAAMPSVFLLASRGLLAGIRAFTHRSPAMRLAGAIALAVALLATGAESMHAYFVTWANHRDVKVAYHKHVVALGRYLDRSAGPEPVVITTLYPGEFHDPYTMEVTVRRNDLDLRWVDGREALFFPRDAATLYIEEQTLLPPVLREAVEPHARQVLTLDFGKDAIPSRTSGYQWTASESWRRVAAGAQTSFLIANDDAQGVADYQEVAAPVAYGDIAQLIGYGLEMELPGASDSSSLQLLTLWEVLSPADSDLAIFAHLLDSNGAILSQDDRLGAPSWQWETGDRFAQVQWLDLPPGVALGDTVIALGMYDRDTNVRLQVNPCGSESGGSESGESAPCPPGSTAIESDAPMTRVLLPVGEPTR